MANKKEDLQLLANEESDIYRIKKMLEEKSAALDLMQREAVIEVALEKVRARTMAMQKSDELQDAAILLFQQIKSLGVQTGSCGFNIWNKEKKTVTVWTSSAEGGLQAPFEMPLTESPVYRTVDEAMRNGNEFLLKEVEGKNLVKHFDYLSTLPGIGDTIKHLRKTGYIFPKRMVFHFAFFKNGFLSFHTHEPYPEAHHIFKRFAKVFEQTYTRFLDLQKAEAQAREAQIEGALEKVRSHTMGMRSSEDLANVASVMFDQMRILGGDLFSFGIVLCDKHENMVEQWHSIPGAGMLAPFFVPVNLDHIHQYRYDQWKTGTELFSIVIPEDYIAHHFELMLALPSVKAEWEGIAAQGIALPPIPTWEIDYGASFRYGYLLVSALKPFEEDKIFPRFAKVFEQTYTRFLDLQKAEAQAREAQIEVALERVRSRAMAMHKSDELLEAGALLYSELTKLGVEKLTSGYMLIDDDEKMGWNYGVNPASGQIVSKPIGVPLTETKILKSVIASWKKREPLFVVELNAEETIKHQTFMAERCVNFPLSKEQLLAITPERLVIHTFNFKQGYLLIVGDKLLTTDQQELVVRFAKVFEMTYRRFLDLKQAEAQTREAQIELSLERVRAKTMAMHNSQDVGDTVAAMFDELVKLGIQTNRCGILIFTDTNNTEVWTAKSNAAGAVTLIIGHLDVTIHPMLQGVRNAWKKKEPFFGYEMIGDDIKNYYNAINNYPGYPTKFDISSLPTKEIHSEFFFADGGIFAFTSDPIPAEASQIFKRFSGVFGQTYRRYLDLQKAEAQAREARIEAALERVRARTMAMHNSEDVTSATETMFDELKKLGLDNLRCGIANVHLNKTFDVFGVTNLAGGNKMSGFGLFGHDEHPIWQRWFESWKNKEEVFIAYIAGQEKEEYFNNINNHRNYLPQQIINIPDNFFQAYYFEQGSVWTYSLLQHSEPEKDIMKRFATGFSLTFRRYQDLKQAEAQAREANIEASLERVRARTMAMHSSEDVSAATATMFIELEKLGIENFRGGITNILSNRTQEVWSVNNLVEGKSVKAVGIFKMDEHPFWQYMYKEWEAKNDFLHYHLAGKEKEDYIKILNATQGYLPQAIHEFPDVHFQVYFFNEGAVWSNSLQPHTEEDRQVVKRFASVFSLTFRRYQDLKKAEAQAREATIEAALEKVRGKAMAMHNSNDLIVTASIVFTELRKLGINSFRSGVGLLTKENRKVKLYSATSSDEGDNLSLVGWAMLEGHEVLSKFYDCWISHEDYFPEMKGELLKTYYEKINATFTVPLAQAEGLEQYGYVLPFSEGLFYGWAEKPYTDAEIKILKRFATVIDLTFRRYIELQKSEANAREAVRSASLDRVRAETASMRTTKDLEIITPLIWNELTTLGVPFIRCGVFIMDTEHQVIHIHLSTPDGKAIAAFHLPYSTPGNIGAVLNHWQQKKIYTGRWSETDFTEIANTLVQQGFIDMPDQYLKTLPQGGFYLHFLPFLQGMLYVGNTTLLNEEDIHLIQSVADAFSTAYARYEDFNKLELAKEQIEKTLVDLKQAQVQLIQSEKMASLGELTAGIAHEIQNPLNFVNNFSEINTELIDELEQEVAKGNLNEIKAIAKDIRENEQKINHHGKRADAIVKGMLQHSRTSTAIKEPTDINKLADEYLRLAYHGLRAKDKSFNATLKTDFDETIGKVSIIPQDIGRVLLNLYNNAFYAVSQKHTSTGLPAGQAGSALKEGKKYEPSVSVSTKKIGANLEIKVTDNGKGISQKIVDKIFQPFFTTKPTGQGTGLGLSLAYDIVKAHGGEIEVQTKEGEGSEFIIQLSVV